MATYHSELVLPEQLTPEHTAVVRRLAARAWLEMESSSVLPTPRNFDLWFTRVSDANPDLSRRLLPSPAGMAPPAAQPARAIPPPELDVNAVADGAEAIRRAAQTVIAQVAGNGDELRRYGDALSQWSVEFNQDHTLSGLMRAIATLTAATARASEHNRTLEQQLSESAARISRLTENLADVKREATTDALTGLCNRKAFDTRLRRALDQAREDGLPLTVIMLDVDHFKRVNDTYGHPVGDLVLRLVGRLLMDNVKGRDLAARYGGEEFAVILAGADLQAGAIVAEQVRAVLHGKRLVNKAAAQDYGSVTASFGVAQLQPDEDAAALVGRADAALYRAKRSGRNQVCVAETD